MHEWQTLKHIIHDNNYKLVPRRSSHNSKVLLAFALPYILIQFKSNESKVAVVINNILRLQAQSGPVLITSHILGSKMRGNQDQLVIPIPASRWLINIAWVSKKVNISHLRNIVRLQQRLPSPDGTRVASIQWICTTIPILKSLSTKRGEHCQQCKGH